MFPIRLKGTMTPPTMKIEAYAKINLTLEVLGKRADGYHALRSVVQPVSLADTLLFEETSDGTISSDTGYGEADLIVKAARLLSDGRGVRVKVEKRIPTGGGLGGGSADAAATLLALNELWGLKKTPEELAALGASVGSDVPALVLANHYREPILMEGRGEVVSRLPPASTPISAPAFLVLANPGVHASTPAVFKAFVSSTYPNPANDLEDPACRLYPEIAAALSTLREEGAERVMMSGSGATVFGFVPSASAAESLAARLTARGLLAWPASLLHS